MSAKTRCPTHHHPSEPSFEFNWKAISTFSAVLTLLVGYGAARVLWHATPDLATVAVANPQSEESASRFVRQSAAIPTSVELELAGSVSALGESVPQVSVDRPAPATKVVAAAKVLAKTDTPDDSSDEPKSRVVPRDSLRIYDDALSNRWFAAVYPLTAESLDQDLHSHSVELSLPLVPNIAQETSAKIVRGRDDGQLMVPAAAPTIVDIAPRHGELAGLPFRRGQSCRKSEDEAKLIDLASKRLRRVTEALASERTFTKARSTLPLESAESRDLRMAQGVWELLHSGSTPEFVDPSIVHQMLQPFDVSARLALVGELSQIATASSTEALTQRAVFDLSPAVRKAACETLQSRPQREYHERLLTALRYPWAPVAFHAAQALIALDDRAGIPKLEELLNAPDPNLPFKDEKGQWTKTELVRVNHLSNCYLCHAPSADRKDLVRAVVPVPGEPLPRSYYGSSEGNFIRADITYLKQDFSINEVCKSETKQEKSGKPAKRDPWPDVQRFDYVVRTRPATDKEIATRTGGDGARTAEYPQRMAVMFALEGLMQAPPGSKARSTQAVNK